MYGTSDSTNLKACLAFMWLFAGLICLSIPSFLNQANFPEESEGKQYIVSMNRAQQYYYLDEQKFSGNIPDLGLGIQTETTNYLYSTETTDNTAFNYGISRHDQVPSYVGAVFAVPATDVNSEAVSDEITTVAILCEADTPGSIKPTTPTYQNGELACGEGTTDLSR
ncbi:MAG: type IV pilin-like G/H family protein [Coleofasciculus sp. G3-WIS-01]|uniref:type IV pilin-like G/H family protein n=1 Tax=Coleofasciculus sp. G3-WIS-01 TaxID=3069528 RepID=UPI0032F354AF